MCTIAYFVVYLHVFSSVGTLTKSINYYSCSADRKEKNCERKGTEEALEGTENNEHGVLN